MYRRVVPAALLVLLVAGVVACGSKSGEPDVAFTVPAKPGATLPGGKASAAGLPCVEAKDVPVKDGKPVVKMPVGPPPTTLQKTDLKEGTGAEVKLNDNIKVQYVGISCSTGKQFDSSWDRGEPADFQLAEGSLIKGWTDGIPGMKVGGQRMLVVPPDLGYGAKGQGTDILGGETLVFVVDVVDDTGATPASTTTAPGAAGASTTVAPAAAGASSTTAAPAASSTTAAPAK